jgi:ABC-type proline/glycine betaine transport system ATPase subunit
MQLEGIMNRLSQFKRGVQQRVALARAFASGNEFFCLRAFSALHYTLKRTLWSLLTDMKKRYNMAILMLTHDLDEAFFWQGHIVFCNGRILQTGTKDDIINGPKLYDVTKRPGTILLPGEVLCVRTIKCVVR